MLHGRRLATSSWDGAETVEACEEDRSKDGCLTQFMDSNPGVGKPWILPSSHLQDAGHEVPVIDLTRERWCVAQHGFAVGNWNCMVQEFFRSQMLRTPPREKNCFARPFGLPNCTR